MDQPTPGEERLAQLRALRCVLPLALAISAASGWAFHHQYWRWRGSFAQGHFRDPLDGTVYVELSYAWGILALAAAALAAAAAWALWRKQASGKGAPQG